jgi:gliding motility-associated-like protein
MKKPIQNCTLFFAVLLLTTFRTFGDESTLTTKKVPEKLLAKYDTDFAKRHPEHGILPFNAPCTDCIELIEKRTPNTREFVGETDEKGEKSIFIQKSYGKMHYIDENGFLVTSDPRLIKESEYVYAARQQPSPVVIDFKNKWASIKNGSKELKFNKNISLELISLTGETQNFGEGNWSKVLKSEYYYETTLTVEDFYPGVNLVMVANTGRLKTNFVITNRLQIDPRFDGGWLAMTQDIDIPEGLTVDLSSSIENAEQRRLGNLYLRDKNNFSPFYFTQSRAYDAGTTTPNTLEMPFTFEGNRIDYYVPVNWLNNKSTLYPVTVDPSVWTGDTVNGIVNSGYSAVCGTLGCSYFITGVMTPPNSQIYRLLNYFSYSTVGNTCQRSDGGFEIIASNPVSGSSCGSGHQNCPNAGQGQCSFWPQQLYYYTNVGGLANCLNPPQCAPYGLDFELQFRRCNWVPIPVCDNSCITGASDWIISIEAKTVEFNFVQFPQTICNGDCADLIASGLWGVPPYTFTWNGTLVGDFVNVCPTTSTNYTCIITDACGFNDTATATSITVVPHANPGFTIAPNDTVCTNTPMTFTGLGAGAATSYDWNVGCSSQSGFNDLQVLNWNAPATTGNCTATLYYTTVASGVSCPDTLTQIFVVEPGFPPQVTITPNNALCPGQAVTYHANLVNGGSSPSFQWYINGVPAGTNADSLVTNALASQFTVSVFVTSNSPCANPDTVTGGIIVQITNAVAPGVVATAVPNVICPGDQITITAVATNGGPTPGYQWTLNGANIPGATNSSYTTTPGVGDIYGVVMTSSLSCVAPTTASDTETVTISPNVAPTVNVVADQPNQICAGTQVTFTANGANAGVPTYQWQLNGANIAGETNSTYTTTPPGTGTYGVIITSSLSCSNPNNANDTILMNVIPTIAPAVSVTASVDTVCQSDIVVFTAHPVNAGTSPSYAWTVNGNSQGGNYDTLNVASPAGSYTVSVTITSNAQCPSPTTATNTYNIFVRPTPVPAVSIALSNDTVCENTPVTFTAAPTNGGTAPTYQWYLNGIVIAGETNSTYNTTPVNTTDIYSVTLTSNALCALPTTANQTSNVVVIPNAIPLVDVASNVGQIVCENTPMTFTASPTNGGSNPGYQWLLNGIAINGATNSTYSPTTGSVLTGSIFECVLTTSLVCAVPTNDNDTLEMTIIPINVTNVALTSTDDTICEGAPVTFTANPTNGGADPTYAWTINGNAVNGNDTSFLSSTTMANGDVVGVSLTSDIACSLPSNTTYTIYVTPTPVPQVSQSSFPASVCVGDVLNFSASGTNGGTAPAYQWYVNGNIVNGATNDTYSSVLNNGDIVTVEMTSNAPCANPLTAASNQITAVVIPYVTPAVAITSSMVNDSICLGQNVTFDAAGVNGGSTPIYTWYVNGVDQLVNGPTFSSSTLIQNDIITVTLTSSEPCLTQPSANSNLILVNVYPPLNVLALGDAIICPYEPVTLNALPGGGDGGPYTFDWSHNAGTDATVIVTPGVTTLYSVTVFDVCGSSPVSDSVLVTVNPSPEADLTYKPNDPSSLAPDVNFFDQSLNPITWHWNFGDGDSSLIEDPPHTYQAPGEYDVTLIVTNIYGCVDSITYKVIVKEDISVFIPNSFTPNSDGANEYFTPMGVSLEDFDFWIFDRWGQEIFHGDQENPWLGLCERTGKPAPEDVYVYKVDLKYAKFGKRYVTGKVSLVY